MNKKKISKEEQKKGDSGRVCVRLFPGGRGTTRSGHRKKELFLKTKISDGKDAVAAVMG